MQGNDVCQIDEELQPHQKYRIRIEMRQKFVEVWMALCTGSSCAAEELRCTEPREDRIAFPHAQVFASDTFYEPADAEIDNFFMTTLEPVAGCTDFSACNHNPRASEDDGSCRRPVNMVCSQQHRVTTKMCQQAAPPPPPSQVYRPSSGQQYRPPPPPAIGGVGSSVGTCQTCSGGGYQQPGSQFGGQVSHCGSRTEFIPEGQPFRLVRGVMEGAEQQHWATPAQQGYGGYGEALHAIVPVPTDCTRPPAAPSYHHGSQPSS